MISFIFQTYYKKCNPAKSVWYGITDTTVDRFPIVRDILVRRGILVGGASLTIVGDRMDSYPVLGARFISDELPELYAYALPALRFTLCLYFVLSITGHCIWAARR